MKYDHLTKEQLLEKIENLELLTQELLREKEQETKLEYSWTGNLGHWYWNIRTNEVTFNPLKVTTLGYDRSEIPENISYQFFTDKLHPEDYPVTMEAMKNHLYGKADVYEVEYRIQTKDNKYKWYYDRGKITQYDEDGKPVFLAGIVFDITEKKETQLKLLELNGILTEMANIDGLTRINNHRSLIEYLKAGISESSRTGSELSIALFDIDDFKKVNDTRGHVYGDKVLADVAKIIRSSIRETDVAGRYGGEEFLVILSSAHLDSAAKTAERIRKSVEEHLFPEGIRITLSGGVKQFEGEELNEFIHEADKRLYEAKKNGKNQIAS